MKAIILLLLNLHIVFAVLFAQSKSAPPRLIPMQGFFRNPEKAKVRISPNGKYYAYTADEKGKMNVFVQPVNGGNAVRATNDTVRSIWQYSWKGNRIIYFQDMGGDENFQAFSVQPDGKDFKALTPFPGVRTKFLDDLRFIPGRDNEVMVTINKRDKQYFDPYLLNIETGALTLLYDNKQNFNSWWIDNNGIIRLATKTDGVNVTYLYRNNTTDSFTTLLTTSFRENFSPQSFDANNKNIYVLSNINRDKIALVEYDPVEKKEVKELYANPDYDLTDAVYDRQQKKLASVRWNTDQYYGDKFFDKDWETVYTSVKQKLKGYNTNIYSWDDNRKKAVFWAGNDKVEFKDFLYDFTSKELKEVANASPWLKEEDMAAMTPIEYKSRDGLTVHGYLTLPKGVEPKNLPVIINPHGGPWYRDLWGLNIEVQFFANRGYAVLQMNFRGSTGYGKQFWESSFKQWGKKMQDDITDGVQWLIKEGIADPKRIGIYGASYGGYAALAGITFTPDLYAAAVDYVGISNLFTILKNMPSYRKPYVEQLYAVIGHPKDDSLLLASASPVLHVDKIKTPLLIAQGANDPRVNRVESDQMVAALKKRGVEVEYIVKDNEGHGFINEDNQFEFYNAMEKFFDKYLKQKKQQH